ncbi:hypothetical protein AMIS_2480 [Actinoplanes missouriensis 431]|uniref:Fibronectin type-III domain-containing protein n=1 Tax=Actinoplanes missouriensis (strain ATCC 14538 / DSM 43046 / CBS 188.64 / JCM 3121 / NBRC 102363 / NCIMB 12654 / NRRL B-3342 / UNCC 431) TaxID=512565 RepID=I0GXI1_ACTM4|nr:fibronectin type III domain-containing protein [Actinoplanes missouriensis]KOX45265.1 hypothetical protein ADL19_23375 [Streptomyces purpurogeneiscleroticus]BAL85468.1 hypothetical protein AMIS_2480 [Actinoplanes missouriensis 431]
MARDWKLPYAAAVAGVQHAATYPAAAIAGRTLVAVGAAPALVAYSAGWDEIAQPLGDGELSVGIRSATGGETALTWDRPSGAPTAPRGLAGWVESRNDLGPVHAGSVASYPNSITYSGQLALTPVTTAVDGCRVYVAISTVGEPPTWAPVFPGALTVDETVVVTGLGSESVRLVVASGVVAAGEHQLVITNVPAVQLQIAVWAMEPVGDPPEEPPPAETAIEAENRLQGVAKSVWDIVGAGSMTIQGYATSTHVPRGQALSLKVHSPAASWNGTVYRLGYYGGAGARPVDTVNGPQTTQPAGTVDPTTLMGSCSNWSINATWTPASTLTPGVYIIKISRNDNAALSSHIGPFVVTDPNRKASIAVRLSDSTWQAYNHAGTNPADLLNGRSIYGTGSATGFDFSQATRARAVSYDRPLVTRQHLPQTSFWNAEYPLIRWLERLGYDVDYLSCAQVDADPSLLLGRDAVISSGHDEYWSAGMRDAHVAAHDHATQASNLVILSGNEAFWRIRWSGDRRTFDCWKDSHDGQLNPTGLYSGTWQDTRSFNPDRRPASLLNGQRFRLNGISSYPMGATAAHASSPLWRSTTVAGLTGSDVWTSPAGIVGFEADEPADMIPSEAPSGLIRLSQITHTVSGMLSDDDGNIYSLSGPYTHAITAYRSPTTGAVVFAAGTVQYAWGLDEVHDRHPGGTLVSPVLQQALTNLLADLGQVPPAYPFPSGLVRPTPAPLASYGFPAIADTTPPSAPTGLQATPGQTQIALTWTAATDNVGVASYDVLRDGTVVATGVTATAYTFTGLASATSYTLAVRARDAAGNIGALASITASTSAPDPTIPGAYATLTQLHDHLGRTPANARQLLLRASRAVDQVILCAIYDPTDPATIAALREAVLEQIAVGLEQGDVTGSGGRKGGGFSFGKISVSPKAAEDRAAKVGDLWSSAWAILQQAGLTGHGPMQR